MHSLTGRILAAQKEVSKYNGTVGGSPSSVHTACVDARVHISFCKKQKPLLLLHRNYIAPKMCAALYNIKGDSTVTIHCNTRGKEGLQSNWP